MRLTSRSNSARSKKCFLDHGRLPFSRVAMTALSDGAAMLLFPVKVIVDTWTVPVSLQADAPTRTRAESKEQRAGRRLRGMTRFLVGRRFRFLHLLRRLGRSTARFQALPQPLHQVHHLAGG